jgi:hypothetical protein
MTAYATYEENGETYEMSEEAYVAYMLRELPQGPHGPIFSFKYEIDCGDDDSCTCFEPCLCPVCVSTNKPTRDAGTWKGIMSQPEDALMPIYEVGYYM